MMRVVSLNVRGLADNEKRGKMIELLKKELKGNILLIQETHCKREEENWWKQQFNMKGHWTTCSERKGGVAILVDYDLFDEVEFIDEKDDRTLYMKGTRESEKWFIGCFYAPNEMEKRNENNY